MAVYYYTGSCKEAKIIKFPVRLVRRDRAAVARARQGLEQHLESITGASERFSAMLTDR
jgi:hypothetical protein